MHAYQRVMIGVVASGVVAHAAATVTFAEEPPIGTLRTLTDVQLDRLTAGSGIVSQNEALAFAAGPSGLADTNTYGFAGEVYGSGQAAATGIAKEEADASASTSLAIDDGPSDLTVDGFASGVAVGHAVTLSRTGGMVIDTRRVNLGIVRATSLSSGQDHQDGVADTTGAANGDIVGAETHTMTVATSNVWMMRSRTIVISIDIPDFVSP